VTRASQEEATRLVRAWIADDKPVEDVVVLLAERGVGLKALIVELAQGVFARGGGSERLFQIYVAAHPLAGTNVAPIAQTCALPTAPALGCWRTLRAVSDDDALKPLAARALDAIVVARKQDVLDLLLLLDEVQLRGSIGDARGALRTLSEMVELAPHDVVRRERYARELIARKEMRAGCEAFGHVTQLDPARREIFRTMMDIRRGDVVDDDLAAVVRSCIVDAVSGLPVQRAISLVLTWEDPNSDVDLHITNPANEEVWYQDKSGNDGGLLYYDVTNGLGPEVYVLGDSPPGEYAIGLVYYRGERTDVAGTLTVLENAGTPTETRRDIPFELHGADPENEVALTVLKR
jgi:hypothetical protein